MQCKFLTLDIVPGLKTYKFEMAINFNKKCIYSCIAIFFSKAKWAQVHKDLFLSYSKQLLNKENI